MDVNVTAADFKAVFYIKRVFWIIITRRPNSKTLTPFLDKIKILIPCDLSG